MASGKKTKLRWRTRTPKRCRRQEYFHSKPTDIELNQKPYKCPLCKKYHVVDCV